MQGQYELYEIIKTQHNEPTQIKGGKKRHVNEQLKAQNSKKLFEAKTPKMFLKQKHFKLLVTLNGQITLYLYNSIKSSKELRVVCETFARKHKCLII